jgi:hypothetical protein
MKRLKAPLLFGLMFQLSGCLNNPTIDEEIAEKCDLSVDEYRSAQVKLDASQDGASMLVGHCRLTRTSKDVIEGTIVNAEP